MVEMKFKTADLYDANAGTVQVAAPGLRHFGGSLRAALVGDRVAKRALEQGYGGFVVNGCVRDTADCAGMDIGLLALAANPTRPQQKSPGERGIPVAFAWVKFTPGEWLYADRDGVLVCASKLL